MPALENTFLFIEPDDNYLNYGSVVLHQIVLNNKRSSQSITELMGTDANPDRIKQELSKSNPLMVAGIGHGNESTYTVQNLAHLLDAGNPDELALMTNRVTSLCSCLTAITLGPALIDAGAVAYTGYNQEFWFYTGDNPGTTHAVQSPFLAEFQFVASLLQGKSTGVAREDQLKQYDIEIDYWLTGAGKDYTDASELSRILQLNKSTSVFLGEGGVQPSPSAPTILVAGTTPWLWIGMAATVSFLIYRELKRKS